MSLRNEPPDWQLPSNENYLPIYYKGELAGFFKQEYADKILKFLNEDALVKKALTKACIDLAKQTGGDANTVKELIKRYIKMSQRPKYGTLAIANFLRERQQEIDISDKEFIKFCDSYMVSPEQLNDIYAGKPIDDSLIAPLARILNVSQARLFEVRDGREAEEDTW
jgi:hypothetical protein